MTTTPTATNALAVDASGGLREAIDSMLSDLNNTALAFEPYESGLPYTNEARAAMRLDVERFLAAIATITAPGIAPAVGAEPAEYQYRTADTPWAKCDKRGFELARRDGWPQVRALYECEATPPAAEAEQPVDARSVLAAVEKEMNASERRGFTLVSVPVLRAAMDAALASRTPPPAQPVAPGERDAFNTFFANHFDENVGAVELRVKRHAAMAGWVAAKLHSAPPAEALGDRSILDDLSFDYPPLPASLVEKIAPRGGIDRQLQEYFRECVAFGHALATRPPATHGVGDAT